LEYNNKLIYSQNPPTKQQIDSFNNKSEQLIKYLINEIHHIDVKQSIARFVLERLINAPWNTTEAFVKTVFYNEGENITVAFYDLFPLFPAFLSLLFFAFLCFVFRFLLSAFVCVALFFFFFSLPFLSSVSHLSLVCR
jgi:hypothetical protein